MDDAPHHILGVPPGATEEQVRKAYKKLARKVHPDVDPSEGAAERFMRIKQAHDDMLEAIENRDKNAPSGTPWVDFDARPASEAAPRREARWPDELPEPEDITLADLWQPALWTAGIFFWLFLALGSLFAVFGARDDQRAELEAEEAPEPEPEPTPDRPFRRR